MKTREELRALRERARESLQVREGKPGARVIIAMGTCGIAAGAREVMTALLEELAQRDIHHVTVTQVGCKGLCECEPVVEVQVPGMPAVTYGNVNPHVMRRIVADQIVNGHIVSEYAIATDAEVQ